MKRIWKLGSRMIALQRNYFLLRKKACSHRAARRRRHSSQCCVLPHLALSSWLAIRDSLALLIRDTWLTFRSSSLTSTGWNILQSEHHYVIVLLTSWDKKILLFSYVTPALFANYGCIDTNLQYLRGQVKNYDEYVCCKVSHTKFHTFTYQPQRSRNI